MEKIKLDLSEEFHTWWHSTAIRKDDDGLLWVAWLAWEASRKEYQKEKTDG
jgi:hypothetical protein